MPRSVPSPDAKIGKKIEFIAAEMGKALEPHGFRRKARQLVRDTGEGDHRCFEILDLQGDKWNEGDHGKFCINIGVQFPTILRHYAELADQAWLLDFADKPDTAASFPRGRLNDALPEHAEDWWNAEMRAGGDIWFRIDSDTDLSSLAGLLVRAVSEYALPWFAPRASLESMFRRQEHFCYSLISGTLLGYKDQVRARLEKDGTPVGDALLQQARRWFDARSAIAEAS